MKGQIDGIGTRPRLLAKGDDGESLVDERGEPARSSDVPAALDKVVDLAARAATARCPAAVGHRVVHGGPDYSAPVVVDDAVLRPARALVPLAPLHQPNNLAPIRDAARPAPAICRRSPASTRPFIAAIPRSPTATPSPSDLYDEGVRRYGFHGLSYEYIAERLREVAPEIAGGPGGRRPSRQRRLDVRASRPAAASTARWASPRSTACRWARGRASSIPASCSI